MKPNHPLLCALLLALSFNVACADTTQNRKVTFPPGLDVALDLGGNRLSNGTEWVASTGLRLAMTNGAFNLADGSQPFNVSTYTLTGLDDGNDIDPPWTLNWRKHSTARASISALGFYQASRGTYWVSGDNGMEGSTDEQPSMGDYQLLSGGREMLNWANPKALRESLEANGLFSARAVQAWDSPGPFAWPNGAIPSYPVIDFQKYRLMAGTNVVFEWPSKPAALASLVRLGLITNAADAPLLATLDANGNSITNLVSVTLGSGADATRLQALGGGNFLLTLPGESGLLATTNVAYQLGLAAVIASTNLIKTIATNAAAGWAHYPIDADIGMAGHLILDSGGMEGTDYRIKPVSGTLKVEALTGGTLAGVSVIGDYAELRCRLGLSLVISTNVVYWGTSPTYNGIWRESIAALGFMKVDAQTNWNGVGTYGITNISKVEVGVPVPGSSEGLQVNKAGIYISLPGADTNFYAVYARDRMENQHVAVTNYNVVELRNPSGVKAFLRAAPGVDATFPASAGIVAYQSYVQAMRLTNSATLDFGSTASMGSDEQSIGVTGAVPGDCVVLGLPDISAAQFGTNFVFHAYCTASGVVRVRWQNLSLVTVDPSPATFKATVLK